jgi:hypothetical protein
MEDIYSACCALHCSVYVYCALCAQIVNNVAAFKSCCGLGQHRQLISEIFTGLPQSPQSIVQTEIVVLLPGCLYLKQNIGKHSPKTIPNNINSLYQSISVSEP